MEQPISQLIENLNRKMDHIITSQNIILKYLKVQIVQIPSDYIVIKPAIKYRDKNKFYYMLRLIILNEKPIQEHFNLKRKPHIKRLIVFLNTLDPKVFDGLKRKQEHY